VPPEQRKAITGHDSLRYFTRAYGVQFEAPRGYNHRTADPSARDVAALMSGWCANSTSRRCSSRT